jgi:SecD/SecF fusion protein
MNRLTINWLIILIVLAVAVANPLYRYMSLKQPIVTLGLDLKGGVEVLLQAVPEQGGAGPQSGMGGDQNAAPAGAITPDQLNGAIAVVRNRVDPQGTKELFISTVGSDRILLQVPGEKNPDSVINQIGKTALLEFIDTGDQSFPEGTNFNQEGTNLRKDEFSKYEVLLTGKDLKRSDPEMQGGRPVIGFEFKPEAAQKFGEYTNNHVGKFLTVILDGVVLTSPSINGPIWGGRGIIEGQMTVDEVNNVVRQLNAGALPVPLQILSASIVGPTLGQESIDNSFKAGIIGLAAVLLFMILFYRLPGVVASVALILYVAIVIGTLSLIGATLTLPGIAGFLLSVGMAVDANIIIFERLKEEIRWGKTLVAAMDAAFARAWVAILDGHVTLLLGAAVLYFLGTGPVKGFAVTLFFGAILALYSGVFVTRTMMDTLVRNVKNPHLYAPHTEELEIPVQRLRNGHYIKFVERTPLWVALSAILIAVGIAFMVMNVGKYNAPFKLGIDFTGGQTIILKTKQEMPVDGEAVTAIVTKYAEGESTVQVNEKDPHIVSIRMRLKNVNEAEEHDPAKVTEQLIGLKEEIGNAFGGYVAEGNGQNPVVQEQNYVGPTVGSELIKNAVLALIIGCVLIMIYIAFRFTDPIIRAPMAIAAIASLAHDVAWTLAVSAILGLEINSSFIAVILTIVGYSINDTIIIFDRIRENLRSMHNGSLDQISNLSLTQTIARSLYTVFTVLFMCAALLVLGGPNIRDFMLAMLAGLLSGMYSSIYIATPIMLWVAKRGGHNTSAALSTVAAGGGVASPAAPAVTYAPVEAGAAPSVAEQVEAARERRERKSGGPKQRRR